MNRKRSAEQVSIGADEYDEDLADDYNNFVNTMVKLDRSLRGTMLKSF